jgi:hypothetical protein
MILKIAQIIPNKSTTNIRKYQSRVYNKIGLGLNTKMEMPMKVKYKRV